MMKKLLFISSFLVLIGLNTESLYAKITLKDCNEIASEVNRTMAGMQIDEITVLERSVCVSGPVLIYTYSITSSQIDTQIFNLMKPELSVTNLNTWCTDPDLKILFDELESVNYKWYSQNGVYLGEVSISSYNC